MKTIIAFLCSFLFLAQARAETELPFTHLPTPVQIVGHSCGQPPVIYSVVGFSQNGNDVLAQVYADTTCPGSGVQGKPTEHKGCAIATWNLFGYLESVRTAACGTVQVYPLQGYSVILQPLKTYIWGIPFTAPYPSPVWVIQ